jgi:hypothetical protein
LISISHYLYRKTRHSAIAVLVILSLCGLASAQLRDRTEHQRADQGQPQSQTKKPAKRGPRAIAVIEFLPKGNMRLVPIALWMDGKYYDASFYGANPEPMALQPETLYEAMNYGEPTGWFTVTTPRQVNGNWVADGKWKAETPFDVMQAHQAAKQPKQKPRAPNDDDSGPPVLRRASGSGSSEGSSGNQGSTTTSSSGSSTAASASNAPQSSSDDTDRPTLKNSSPSSSTASNDDSGRPTLKNSSPSASSSAPSSNDSDRPTLKDSSSSSSSSTTSRPTLGGDTSEANAQPPTATPPPATSSPDENDPDRPVLQRGKPKADTSAASAAAPKIKVTASKAPPPATAAPAPKASSATTPPQLSPQPGHAYPAISDAGIYETRSMMYPMTSADREERGKPMLALALDEVRAYHTKRLQAQTGPKPAITPKSPAKTTAKSENFVVSDYDLRAFDLDFNNSPTFVLTAKVTAPSPKPATGGQFDYFITLVARVDINGQVQKVFSSVTDNNHLDAFPRMEIIDALDADANGRGDLLFRQYSDGGISYALYRVYPYQMVKVFEGGAGI